MKYALSLHVTVNGDEERAEAFSTLTSTARSIDSIFPNISVSSYELDEVLTREVGEEYFDEYTLFKVVHALREAGVPDQQAEDAINQMQNAGILFRERA